MNDLEQLTKRYNALHADMNQLFLEVEEFAKRENPLQKGDVIKSVGLKYKGRKLLVTDIQVNINSFRWSNGLTYSADTIASLLDGTGMPEAGKSVRIKSREHSSSCYKVIKRHGEALSHELSGDKSGSGL